ncbi:MAG: lytic transglycosylase domain-containing protein [Anaerolineaceae bacterium]|nr:MAG: lytic transglycosylase domain-containing protein [Anaerolineaceae bacterium]
MSKVGGISNLQSTEYDIKNRRTNKAGSENFASYMEENTSLDDIFERASVKYNVPLNLLKAIGKAESDFNSNAVSKSGAQGVMQLMPGTAADLGVTDSFDPEQNIMGGSKYISDLLKRYDGDTKLALAAYNAGMNNVKKYGGIPPFKETQNYVVKVMKYMEQDFTAGSVATTGNKQSAPTNVRAAGIPAGSIPNWHTPPAFPSGKLSADSISDMLDMLFSYQDYMKFIDIFLAQNENN